MLTKNKSGFTLIELLVVISIISLLSTLAITALNNARKKSRDAVRKADLAQIRKALDLYLTNRNTFPIFETETTITGDDALSQILEDEDTITEVPTDPQHPEFSYTYQSDSLGTSYSLNFCLETETIINYSPGCGNSISP